MKQVRMNVGRLVEDLGGAAKVAAAVNKSRTTPYSWIKANYISSQNLALIKGAHPDLDLDLYFEPVEGDGDERDRSEGT